MTKTGKLVLLLNLLTTIACSLLGAIIGGDTHPIAGALIGGTIGYAAPCLLAHFVRKYARAGKSIGSTRESITSMLAAVATNESVTNDNRRMVQSIRGVTVVSLLGVICGTLAAWAIAGPTVPPVSAGAAGGAVLGGLLGSYFEFWF